MSIDYDIYLEQHLEAIVKGADWMAKHLPDLVISEPDRDAGGFYNYYVVSRESGEAVQTYLEIHGHDRSKTDPEEYEPYDKYFYQKQNVFDSRIIKRNFDYAWLRHIHRNRHHWQHWILINDDPLNRYQILRMPPEAVIEMILDWWTFSWRQGDLYEIFRWYDRNKKGINLHQETRKHVEEILAQMKDILDSQKEASLLGLIKDE